MHASCGPDHLSLFRLLLETELAEIASLVSSTAADRSPVELDQQSVGRLARMDAMRVQAMALEMQRNRQARQGRIEAALKRITSEEFGFCEACGNAIAIGRLKLDPTHTRCIVCAP